MGQRPAGTGERSSEWAFGKESVVKAIEAVGRGELVVVVDDESRENEGDLIMVRFAYPPPTDSYGGGRLPPLGQRSAPPLSGICGRWPRWPHASHGAGKMSFEKGLEEDMQFPEAVDWMEAFGCVPRIYAICGEGERCKAEPARDPPANG